MAATAAPVFVLGGAQTDFARNWTREGLVLADLLRDAAQGALADADVDPTAVEVGHVGNFVGELFCNQGHLGGLLVEADPAFEGLPTMRHEAACASGSMAVLAAMADLAAGRYDVALVVGVELMRNVNGFESQAKLGAAAWTPEEIAGRDYPWPSLFADLADAYDERWGLDHDHLAALARSNFANARRNPLAQTRSWSLPDEAFATDAESNPPIAGRLHKLDCSQVTDGAAAVVLASPRGALEHARRHGLDLDGFARIDGWGHRTGRMRMADKLAAAPAGVHLLPHVCQAVDDALGRAGLGDITAVDTVETHDCFTISHYAAIDHLGITPAGQSWQAIEDGTVLDGGSLPINPSGGLMGVGHPVGATGVRMLFDAASQVTGTAGECQVPGAQRALTLNIGGSATTVASFVVTAGSP
ncbi:MAG: acetyl-CoA acetyltransferase [Acidimicrobiales bacterium]|nr:acetyl-CoA acetyltransferase [Acidimicrobiales bacterium]